VLHAMLAQAWAERDAERAEKVRLVAERDQRKRSAAPTLRGLTAIC
jgi:hypothetical protein